MTRIALAAAAFGLMLAPAGASACEAQDFETAIMHSALPTPLPAGTIIADVALDEGEAMALWEDGVRARIRRLIQGDYRGATLIVRQRVVTSCGLNPFANGRAGLIVARPVEMIAGELVVAPIEVDRMTGYRLPDGYQLPKPAPGDVELRQ